MKKIFDWTIGSFFRSIGRIIAYVVIGGFIAMLLSNSDFRLPKFGELLGIDYVYAQTGGVLWVPSAGYSTTGNGPYTSVSRDANEFYTFSSGSVTGNKTWFIKFDSNKTFPTGTDYYYVNIKLSFPLASQSSSTTTSQFTCNINDTMVSNSTDFEYLYNSFTCTTINSTTSGDVSKFGLGLQYTYNDTDYFFTPCYATANAGDIYTFRCPVVTNNIRGLRINVNQNGTNVYFLGFQSTSNYTIDNTANVVTQQQQTNDILSDDNTSSESSDASTFFHNTDTSSTTGLTSIVSSPLTLINGLTSGSNNNLCFTLKGKQSCLPSGSIIWGKTQRTGINWFGTSDDISTGVNAFKVFFNLVVGGYLLYKMTIGLFLLIERMLSPTNNQIEVMKL